MIAIGLLISAGAAAEDAAVTVETENAEDCVGPWGATYVECREFMFRDLPAPDGGLPYQAFVATAHGANSSLLDQVARISGR